MKTLHKNSAVSEVIGTVLMLGIAIGLFSILYFVVFSYPFTPNPPSVHLVGSVEETNITIANLGGNALNLDTRIIISSGDVIRTVNAGDLPGVDSNGDGYWGVGEILRFTWTDVMASDIQVMVVDQASNAVVMSGVLPIPYIATAVNPIIPSSQTTSPLTITASSVGDITPDDVTLWYRFGILWKDDFNNRGNTSSSHNITFNNGYVTVNQTGVNINHFVNQISNVDNSSDTGTHSNFNYEKAIGGGYDVLTEGGIITYNVLDSVDLNSVNVDSIVDKGIEINFSNAQNTSRDGKYMTIQEFNQSSISNENLNYVDAISTSYPPSDIGTHSNFAEMQDRDGFFDTLTESMGGQVTYQSSGTASGRTSGNPTPAYPPGLQKNDLILLQLTLRAGDSPVTVTPPTGFLWLFGPDQSGGIDTQVRQWIYYKFSDGTESGSVTVTVTGSDDDRTARMYAFRNVALTDFIDTTTVYSNYDTYLEAPTLTTTGVGWLAVAFVSVNDNVGMGSFTGESGGDWTEAGEYLFDGYDDLCMQLQTATLNIAGTITGGGYSTGNTYREVVRAFALKPIVTNRLDLEVRWTTADYSRTNEYLCIYGGTQDSEALRVDVWNGAAWTPILASLSSGWNNISVSSYLNSASFYIRFMDMNQSNDTSPSSWQVEGVLLHTWTATTNNQIDFEYQWTTATYNQLNEQVCIYIASHTGSESLQVNYWTGSIWSSLRTISSTGWTNFTATGLTSSTYTIQLKGTSESSDTFNDQWNIDCLFLHCWTGEYSMDLEIQWTNVDFNQENEMLCLYMPSGLFHTENIRVDVWDTTTNTWYPLFQNLLDGWNNQSVHTWLTSSTFTIRYKDSISTSDSTLDTWRIDAAVLHLSSEYYQGDLTSITISKSSDSSWGTFNAEVNNTANSMFFILDQSGNPLLSNLQGNNNDISSITTDTIRLYGRMNGPVMLSSWSVTTRNDWRAYGTDTQGSDGWSWSFPFLNSGTYWFYSMGRKANFADESPPVNPNYDTQCRYRS